jgi:hypothetical protein
MLKSWLRAALIAALMLVVCGAPSAAPRDSATLIAELNALNTANYTGGLPRRNRALAEEIRAAMLPQFPAVECPPHDWRDGTLIAGDDDTRALDRPAGKIDANLAELLSAFNHERQEVRDTASYAIGLLGPSAVDARPALRSRFGGWKGKGNWHNDAYAKVTCQSIGPADFRKVIPDALLPPQAPWTDFLRKATVLLAKLYLDPDVEYPPDMMGNAYSSYSFPDNAADAVPLLAQVLDDDRLSLPKHIEAAAALQTLTPEMAMPALPSLLHHARAADPTLRHYVAEALIKAKHDAAIPLLIERVEAGAIHWSWRHPLCAFGARALVAEDALLDRTRREREWPTNVRAAYRVLGCIGSRKSVPTLAAGLAFPDWETRGEIAIALGNIPDPGAEAIAALETLAARHWSKLVRTSAENALMKLGQRAPRPEVNATDYVEPLDVMRLPWSSVAPVDHGLPWCNPAGKYSIDGRTWFRIKWERRKGAALPKAFPVKLPEWGTRQFVRVEDGWLYGADFGHEGGRFQHISDAGKVSELDETWHNATQGFVHDGGAILAYGYQILKSGDGGVLFNVARNTDGVWRAARIATLPSPAHERAKGPNGEILLSDTPNQYAVIEREIVPLKCEKVFKGSFFDRNNAR